MLASIAFVLGLLRPGFSMLDVGGGSGIAGIGFWQRYGLGRLTVLDKFDYPPLPVANATICADALDALDHFAPRSFDVVQSTEVLEHLPHEDGAKFLSILSSLASSFAGISTPNGYMEHGWRKTADGRDNPYQEHLCGWHYHELINLGWKCHANGINELGKFAAFQNVAYKVSR
jgi:hypothetical protein